MLCGWGCGAQLTGRNMRAHSTICAKRPAASDHVDRGGRNPKAKCGFPSGGACAAGPETHGGLEAVAFHQPCCQDKDDRHQVATRLI